MIKAIYQLINKINKKRYIGQSVHPEKRLWEHEHRAKNNIDDYPIHNAIAKYGIENFDFQIIEWTEDFDVREAYYINKYNTLCPNGYNVIEGGHSPIMFGECHPRNTISNENLINIINDLKFSKYSDREIAKKYHTTDKIVADINHGYSHKIENEKYPLRIKKGLQKIDEEQLNEIIIKLKTTNLTYQQIGDKFGLSKGAIYHINKGLTFYKETEIYPLRKRKASKE